MTHSWNNKVVLVTGGSNGLGRAIATQFARQGAELAIVARDENRLGATAEALRDHSSKVRTYAHDITGDSAAGEIVAQVEHDFSRLDVVVNAAGKSARGLVADISTEELDAMWQLNVVAPLRLTQALLPLLAESQGSVVNIGSLASKVAAPYLGAYPITKFSLAAWTQQLRREVKRAGIHVLLVCPGPLAREDAGRRYDVDEKLPESARQPGGGAKLAALDPHLVAKRIVQACERRQPELVFPNRVRLLNAIEALFPALADRILAKNTGD